MPPQALISSRPLISLTLSHSHLTLNPFPYPISPPLLFCFLVVRGQFPGVQSVWCGEVGAASKTLFPLHFTQGLEMRQTQLQTDEAPPRAFTMWVCVWAEQIISQWPEEEPDKSKGTTLWTAAEQNVACFALGRLYLHLHIHLLQSVHTNSYTNECLNAPPLFWSSLSLGSGMEKSRRI